MPVITDIEQIEEYRRLVLMHADRAVSFVDRRPKSRTYGCCYPTYWRSREASSGQQVQREVNSRWQEIGLTLALLYESNLPGNPLYRQEEALEWIRAILRFWAGLQSPDGSFTKWRADGRELWPTASTTAAMAKTFRMMTPYLQSEDKQACLPAFKRAAEYLSNHTDYEVPHHETAAIDALYRVHWLLPQFHFDETARFKLENLAQLQEIEGWLPVFDGPDMGDLTLGLYYLGSYYHASKDAGVEPVIENILDFIRYFIYPDGISGGGFNTRYASVLLPTGFAILQNDFPVARAILPYAIRNLSENLSSGVVDCTDYHNAVYLYKYLETLNFLTEELAGRTQIQHFIPAETGGTFFHHCPKGQILVEKRSSYYAVCSNAGSIAALYNYRTRSTQMLSSPMRLTAVSGLRVVNDDSIVWTSQLRNDEEWEGEDGYLKITSKVAPMDLRHSTRWMLPSERRAPFSRFGISTEKLRNSRLFRYISGKDKNGLFDKSSATFEYDDEEHFEFKRALEFREHSIAFVNEIRQKTKDRPYQKAHVCESVYIPPYRDPELYRIGVGSRDYMLSQLRPEQTLEGGTITIYYNGILEWTMELDGTRSIQLSWLNPTSPRDNILLFLNGSCLLIGIDIQRELKSNWKARVDYRISMEYKRSRRGQIAGRSAR